MAQTEYRGNTQSMSFPLLSTHSAATVINPQLDQTFVRGVNAQAGVAPDTGIPQAFFCENVMPSTFGWQSIAYDKRVDVLPEGETIKRVSLVKSGTVSLDGETQVATPTGNQTLLGIAKTPSEEFSIVALDTVTAAWINVITPALGMDENSEITVATLNGVTFIYISKIGCFVYNDQTTTLQSVSLISLQEDEIIGIAAANGYMIAYSETAVSWSSVVNVLDFEPSDTTGAGGGQLQEAAGAIVCIVTTSLGFLVYTVSNIVSALYSGNEAYPFAFKALASSGGITDISQVTDEQSTSSQYAYTSNGLQQVSHQRCQTTLPNVTDFLESKVIEQFNFATNEITEKRLATPVTKVLAIVSDRYFVTSYGEAELLNKTQAIVIDTAQSRMGKLNFPHVQVFELPRIGIAFAETPRESIALLTNRGEIYTVNFNELKPAFDSVLYLGKYQAQRGQGIELQEIYLSNIQQTANLDILILPSIDSKNFEDPSIPYLYQNTKDIRHYLVDGAAAFNQSVIIKGTFNLMDFRLTFNLHGRI